MADLQTVRAYADSVNQTPRKLSLVASLVRGRNVDDALVILSHTPKRAALPVKKTIESAKANAINNHGLDGKNLTISTLSVTSSVRLKRFKPAAMGRPRRFQKKTANILVEVTGDIKPKKPTVKKATVKKETE
jgi:large subunit ribosomal protein L22